MTTVQKDCPTLLLILRAQLFRSHFQTLLKQIIIIYLNLNHIALNL